MECSDPQSATFLSCRNGRHLVDSMSGVVTGKGTSITWHDMLHFLDSVEYVEDKIRSAVHLLKPVQRVPLDWE